jgi:hypothetical protein
MPELRAANELARASSNNGKERVNIQAILNISDRFPRKYRALACKHSTCTECRLPDLAKIWNWTWNWNWNWNWNSELGNWELEFDLGKFQFQSKFGLILDSIMDIRILCIVIIIKLMHINVLREYRHT